MKSFKEFITEIRKFEPTSYVSSFENKLKEPNFTKEEIGHINNGIQSLTRCKEYNNHCLIRGEIPTEQTNDPDKKRVARMFRLLFDPKNNANIEGKHVLYHGTKHDINFDDIDGDDLTTTIKPALSSSTSLKTAKKFLTNGVSKLPKSQQDVFNNMKQHHILAIHYDSIKHNNVPAVNISHHSSIKNEDEIILPPKTTFKHINTESAGINDKTGKPILIHHVEPVYTHPSYDSSFSNWTDEQKRHRMNK